MLKTIKERKHKLNRHIITQTNKKNEEMKKKSKKLKRKGTRILYLKTQSSLA